MNDSRSRTITRTAILGIVVNLLIALMKIVIGAAAASLAIVSEGINNASDAASSFLTLVGAKLAEKHPDEKHPFGYGRIEYLTGMVVGVLILYTGITLFRESIEAIIHPEEMTVTILAIVVVAASAAVKFFLGMYTIRKGKETASEALTAVGTDCRNDSFFSLLTIISSIVFLVKGISLDAYAGLIFALVILKSAYETLRSIVSELIGRPGEAELAKDLYKEIRGTEGILYAVDMMLHNYGPERYSGSVNIEIDHNKTVGEVYESLHALQLRLMYEYHVAMVFGIYAVDKDSAQSKELRRRIAEFIKSREHIKSFHALYVSEQTKSIYCDFIVDYELKNWEMVREEFIRYMQEGYPQYEIVLTIETEFV